MKGQRLPDLEFRVNYKMAGDPPGSFRKITGYPKDYLGATNLSGELWFVTTPNGLVGNLANHTVREEADGSISVRPGDGSSNSILVHGAMGKSWHGYIESGVWSEV